MKMIKESRINKKHNQIIIIINELKKAKPNYSIISEESGIEKNKDVYEKIIEDAADKIETFIIEEPP